MEEKNIRTIDPTDIEKVKKSDNSLYYKGLCIHKLHPEITQNQDMFNYPHRINTFFILICKRGGGKINVNLSEFEISENSIFINTPNNIIQLSQHCGQKTDGVVISFGEEFAREINFDVKNLTPIFLKVKNSPIINLSERECDQLINVVNMLGVDIHSGDYQELFYDETIRNLTSYLLHKLCGMLSRQLQAIPSTESSAKNRNEEYFHKFMKVLGENYKQERSLGFYASQLYITPKYLTTIIKKVSGRSAAEWIDSYVTLEAKNLLRYSSMSIQEVAYTLNFPNQSFFGKYFKHQTGYSPSAYKLLK